MPLHDWQFYVVTLIALAGLALVLAPRLRRSRKAGGSCPNCASGSAASRRHASRRVSLTVDRHAHR